MEKFGADVLRASNFLIKNSTPPEKARGFLKISLLPFPQEQTGGHNLAFGIQAEGRKAGQSRGISKGQLLGFCRAGDLLVWAAAGCLTKNIQTAFCLAPLCSHRAMCKQEQGFTCCGPTVIAKICGTKKTAALLVLLQLAKTPSVFSLSMMYSPSIYSFLYRKHHGLEKFISTAVCQNTSLPH